MGFVGVERRVDGEHGLRVAGGAKDDGADLGLVEPKAQQRIVELAEGAERPRLIAGGQELVAASPAAASRAPRWSARTTRFARSIEPFTYL